MVLVAILVVAALILVNAVYVAAEFAAVSVRRSRLRQLADDGNPLARWLLPRVLELTYTAWDMQPFAKDCGYDGPPFAWDEERRFRLRCELDAAYFHLYGIGRDDVDYILETFPIVKRKDKQAHGPYRTECVILDIYDAMQQAMETGTPYRTRLDPPPAHGGTPPEITLEAATGRQGAGAREDTARISADAQRRAASALSQPAFHFDDVE